MTKQDPKTFLKMSAERFADIFPDSLWNNQAWLKPESISELSEHCNEHRMYVYRVTAILKTKHARILRKCKELKDEVCMQFRRFRHNCNFENSYSTSSITLELSEGTRKSSILRHPYKKN